MKKQTLTKLTSATLATTLVTSPFLSPLTTFAQVNTSVSSSDLPTELNASELSIPSESATELDPQLSLIESMNSTIEKSTFNLNDWKYSLTSKGYELQKYYGTSTQLTIPGELNGKPVYLTNLSMLPADLTHLTIKKVNGKKVKLLSSDLSQSFKEQDDLQSVDLSGLDTSNVTDMSYFFYGASNLTSVNLSGLNTSKVVNMSGMFGLTDRLTSLDLSSFNTANVTKMNAMFYKAKGLKTLNLKNFNTARVTDMSLMFTGASNLTQLDLSSFNTTNVRSTWYMFADMSKLSSLNVSSFNTKNNTNLTYMFQNTPELTQLDLRSFKITYPSQAKFMFSCQSTSACPKALSVLSTDAYFKTYDYAADNRQMFQLTYKQAPSSTTTAIYGTGVPGAAVGAYLNGTRLGITTVNAKGNYKLVIPAQKAGTTFSLRMAMSGYKTVAMDVTVLKDFKTLTFNQPTPSTTVISGKGEAGAKVGVYLSTGKRLGITTVASNGTYQLTIPKQKAGTSLIIKQAKTGFATLSKTTSVALETFKTFTYSALTPSTSKITGKGHPGALVGIYDKNGKRLAITTVASNRTYTLTYPKQKVGTVLSLRMAKTGYEKLVKSVTVRYQFKTFTVKTQPTVKTKAIYGTGEPGAYVRAYVDGKAISTLMTVNAKGNYKLVIPAQKAGTKVQIKMAKTNYQTVSQTVTVTK